MGRGCGVCAGWCRSSRARRSCKCVRCWGGTGVLQDARLNGTFQVRHIPPTGGRGKPVPLMWSDCDLDPSARGLKPPDALWGETAVARCPALRMDDEILEQA